MRLLGVRAILVGMLLAASPVLASGADVVRTRITGYREMGAAFKSVTDSLRGDPQTIVLQQAARQIRNTSRMQYGWFPAGSGAEAGVKTAAKAAIWGDPVKFKAAQDALAREADIFQKIVATGNATAIRDETRKLGAVCKGCHETFRAPSE